jgi:hypothetical protein
MTRNRQAVQEYDLEPAFETKMWQGKPLPKLVLTQAIPQPEDPYQLTSFLVQKLYGRDYTNVNGILRRLSPPTIQFTNFKDLYQVIDQALFAGNYVYL